MLAERRRIRRQAIATTTTVEQDLLDLRDPSRRTAFLGVLRFYTFAEFVEAAELTRRLQK